MLIGLVAADVRPDRRYRWRATLLGRFHRSVACALRAVYEQSGHRQQPGALRARLGAIHQTAAAVLRPFTAQLIRRKLQWPFAAACVILLIIGVVGDLAAVGA
jgi:hypothetical protein